MMPKSEREQHKIFSKEEIQIVLEDFAISGTYASAGRALAAFKETDSNMTERAKSIILAHRFNPEYADIFREKQPEFKHFTLLVAEKAARLLDVRLDIALENANELKKLLSEVALDNELTKAQKEKIYKKINDLRIDKTSELAVVSGTMYDKHRLADNKSTDNSEVKVSFTDGTDEYGD